MMMPACLAASTMSVPSGTHTCRPSILRVIRFSIPLFLQVSFEISSEMFDAGKHRHDRELAQSAEALVLHLGGDGLQQVNVFVAGTAGNDAGSEVVHPVSPFTAGGAFTAGFMFEEVNRAIHHA